MERYRYLIIGGGIAGLSAAEAIRAHDAARSIAIVCAEPHLPYSRVLLPSYLKKRIGRERLFVRTPQHFVQNRIEILLDRAAVKLDTGSGEVVLSDGTSLGYEKLLIASGGRVAPWGLDTDQKYIHRLHTLQDADRLHSALARIQRPLVVGSSFIALEFLEIFASNKTPAHLITRGPHVFSAFLDAAGGELLSANLARHGVILHAQDEIATIVDHGEDFEMTTRNGEVLAGDAIGVGVGIERNREIFEGSGIRFGLRGIAVNEFLETNIPGVFAAGDIAEYTPTGAEKGTIGANWTNAVLQGERAGRAMAGYRGAFTHVPAYSITNFGFQITILGQCDPAMDTIVRMEKGKNHYERFFIHNGLMTGAVLINRFADKTHLAALIGQKTEVETYRRRLSDPLFDIRKIPLIQ
ncbi:MAG: FAD-dependent oxidoreductase [Candidatus Sungbacteria bacterium]|uniref:FAD-dependent oxidoreductase n=1 Tax=Candidatus Sungiibacteriota bacterium TaxID=2750080 RepID=A0A932VRD5_9BACT|nr:FAD-dependent oxidoreductase [Candidatus Sungbacteria bacterium]